MNLTHISAFSGIGGFDLAFRRAGVPTLAACEIDRHAAGVIRDQLPTHIFDDIREVTGDSLRDLGADPARTVFTAGWPCPREQPGGPSWGHG